MMGVMSAKTLFYLTLVASALFALAAVMNVLRRQWLVAGLWGAGAVIWLIVAFRRSKRTNA